MYTSCSSCEDRTRQHWSGISARNSNNTKAARAMRKANCSEQENEQHQRSKWHELCYLVRGVRGAEATWPEQQRNQSFRVKAHRAPALKADASYGVREEHKVATSSLVSAHNIGARYSVRATRPPKVAALSLRSSSAQSQDAMLAQASEFCVRPAVPSQ